jgi:Domain of unknown function (DUF4279)
VSSTPVNQSSEERFHSSAMFRVHGAVLDLDGVTRALGLAPTHTHKLGDLSPQKHPYPSDMWYLDSPLGENQPLEFHLSWLAERLLPLKEQILSLKKDAKVDIYCSMGSATEQSNLYLSGQTLKVFTELGIALDVSLIFLPDDPE